MVKFANFAALRISDFNHGLLVQEEIRLGRFHSVGEVIEKAVYALREKSKMAPAPPRQPRKNLADFLLESPFAGSELDLERHQDYGRPVDL